MHGQFNSKCTISYYTEGSRNDLGEPSRTLTERASNVACNLQPRSRSLAYEFPQSIRIQDQQGIIQRTTHILFLRAGQSIANNDVITDANGNQYTVAWILPWKRGGRVHHVEALLVKVTGI
jgi:hypothetical protein